MYEKVRDKIGPQISKKKRGSNVKSKQRRVIYVVDKMLFNYRNIGELSYAFNAMATVYILFHEQGSSI